MTDLSTVTNEELLDLFLGALALKKLHTEKGGLEQHFKHAEEKIDEFRKEILRRMGSPND